MVKRQAKDLQNSLLHKCNEKTDKNCKNLLFKITLEVKKRLSTSREGLLQKYSKILVRTGNFVKCYHTVLHLSSSSSTAALKTNSVQPWLNPEAW